MLAAGRWVEDDAASDCSEEEGEVRETPDAAASSTDKSTRGDDLAASSVASEECRFSAVHEPDLGSGSRVCSAAFATTKSASSLAGSATTSDSRVSADVLLVEAVLCAGSDETF